MWSKVPPDPLEISCLLRCCPNKGNEICCTNFLMQASQETNPTNDQIKHNLSIYIQNYEKIYKREIDCKACPNWLPQ